MFLSLKGMAELLDAETAAAPTPVPTRMISNGEFLPSPQTEDQKRVESRILELADALGAARGMDRRRFLQTASGMAAAFLAMNEVFGPVFRVGALEAAEPGVADARAGDLAGQFIFDAQVHFVKDHSPAGSNPYNMVNLRRVAAAYLNPELRGKEPEVDDIKFQNFFKEIYLDSDTKMAILSGAPSDQAENWFLSNDQMARARAVVNEAAGSRRLLSHAVITPGQPGWLEEMDRAIEELHPDSWKGYTMGDPNGPSEYRWRLDDEELLYPAYEKMVNSGINVLCLHKGLLPPDAETSLPGVTRYADVSDVGKAARDWPQIRFLIYHCAYNVLMPTEAARQRFEGTGYIEWVSDLARIPAEFGVENVYAEIGSSFGISAATNPRFCAGMMGALVKEMGAERVFWGTDSVWYGSPQWQIEALRRMEIPEDLRVKFDFAPLGEATGPVKTAILGGNSARLYGVDVEKAQAELAADELSALKKEYEAAGPERSNLAYGFVTERI